MIFIYVILLDYLIFRLAIACLIFPRYLTELVDCDRMTLL